MEPLANASLGNVRSEPYAGPFSRLIGLVLGLFVRNVPSEGSAPDSAGAAEQLQLHLALLSDAELADYGLRREQIAEFVQGGRIQRP
jgi:hypothetical protein